MSDEYWDWETKKAIMDYFDRRPEEQNSAPPEQAGDFYVVGKCLSRYFGPGGDVSIPEGITGIGCGVFQDCEAAKITGITIPKSITRIDNHVFPYCANLSEIRVEEGNPRYCVIDGLLVEQDGMVLHSCPPTRSGVLAIPEGITEIGNSAFAGCSNLTEVIIPEGVTKIGDDAFKFCGALTSVTIPEGVAHIGWSAFWNCGSLKDVTIPRSVTYIGNNAFMNCTNLTSVTIPEGVAHIGWGSFIACTNLAEIRVEAGNPHFCAINGMLLERDGFTLYLHTCPAAKSGVLEIPEGVTRVAECAFDGCADLTEVIIPGSVREIDECAFFRCSGLTEVIIPENVWKIDDSAFEGCTNLTHVALSQRVTHIGSGAFRDTGMSKEAVQAAYDQAEKNDLELELEAFDLLDNED